MHTSLVITVIGDDRPGIVEQSSEQVLAADDNQLRGVLEGIAADLTVDVTPGEHERPESE